jgi:acyl-coenzyme A thioesterase PaaI-like protein
MTELVPRDGELFDEGLYDQYCHACGRQNPTGLQLRFRRDGEAGVVTSYTPKPEDVGFPGVLHGGILATLMDEAMAWSMYAAERVMGVTAKMEMKYRRQVRLDGELTVRGVITRIRGRRIEVDATILDAEGQRLVESSALFLRLPPQEEQALFDAMGWPSAGAHTSG